MILHQQGGDEYGKNRTFTPSDRPRENDAYETTDKVSMLMNGVIRFWINSEPGSSSAFHMNICIAFTGTGKVVGYPCKKCQSTGFTYVET